MVDRVQRDRGNPCITPFDLGNYLAQGKDWKVWFFAMNFGLSATVTYCRVLLLADHPNGIPWTSRSSYHSVLRLLVVSTYYQSPAVETLTGSSATLCRSF